jgi:GNAT superfamily N-acetyltransferase
VRLESVPPGPARHALLPILRLADDLADSYVDLGDLWVYGDQTAEGVVLTIPYGADGRWPPEAFGPGTVELRNVAVRADQQGQGVGRAMVEAVVGALRGDGRWTRAVVGTGTADPVTYVFYQRCGFRPHHVLRDVFTVENGYDPELLLEDNGLTHRDMLWFDLEL